MSRGAGYRIVALRSAVVAASVVSGVPSSKQKFRERSAYVRLQVGQRFMLLAFGLGSLVLANPESFHRRPEAEGQRPKSNPAKIKGKLKLAQGRIGLPQRPQNFVPAG